MSSRVDIRVEIDEAPLNRFHLLLGVMIGVILFFDGYDLFNAAYAAPYVQAEWRLNPTQLGALLSAGIVGLALGSAAAGYGADRFGRRRMLLFALWLITAASASMVTLVHGFSGFAIARIGLGFGLGMVTPLALTYLNEWAPKRYANRYATTTFVVGFAAGGIAAGLVGIFLPPRFGWRSLYVVGALSALVAVAAQVWLHETIPFLANKKRWTAVRSALIAFRPERLAAYEGVAQLFEYNDIAVDSEPSTVGSVLASRTTFVIWIVGALSLFCVHGLSNWLPTVLINKGAPISTAFTIGIFAMVAQIVGGLTAGQLADWLHRRREVMAVTYGVAAITALVFAVVSGLTILEVLLVAACFFLFGAQSVLNNFTALSYPSSVRATGTGVAVGIARVGGILGPFVIGVLQSTYSSLLPVFVLLAIALATAAGTILFARPELP